MYFEGNLMNNNKMPVLSFVLAFAVASPILHAEATLKAGKEKSSACAGCHGENGNSMVSTFPKLAEQHASYLLKQLQAFKDGSRSDPMMSSIAQNLSDEESGEIAAFYSTQKISDNAMPALNTDQDDDDEQADQVKPNANVTIQTLMARGSDLYRNGDLTLEVSACIACHGPHGEGNRPAAFPSIKSQHADYLIKTLKDFKSGARSNNPDNIMHMIAKKMTDEEIKAVSYYISMMK
jgi:cytochrome c553